MALLGIFSVLLTNRVVDQPLPGALRDLAGVHVLDYTALLPTGTGVPCGGPESLELVLDGTTHCVGADVWMDDLVVNDAEVLGTYRGGPFDGSQL